ncbi:MAG: thiamine pyrophosphate-dependent enzyme, partial [Clostridia bacterium]
LDTYYECGSVLSGHVSHKNVPGVEFSSGSLGLGIGIATGMALAGKLDKKDHHVYVVIGDGECNEGSVWEAAMFASQNKLNNLTIIVDCNKFQAMGKTENIINMNNMEQKWQAFGFKTISVDGHNHEALKLALNFRDSSKPVCVIANTIKGKGVSFMENNIKWHYKTVNDEELAIALKEIEEAK